MKIYQYRHNDGRILDLSELLADRSKAYVAAKAARLGRYHAAISALEALLNAGEKDTLAELIASPRYGKGGN